MLSTVSSVAAVAGISCIRPSAPWASGHRCGIPTPPRSPRSAAPGPRPNPAPPARSARRAGPAAVRPKAEPASAPRRSGPAGARPDRAPARTSGTAARCARPPGQGPRAMPDIALGHLHAAPDPMGILAAVGLHGRRAARASAAPAARTSSAASRRRAPGRRAPRRKNGWRHGWTPTISGKAPGAQARRTEGLMLRRRAGLVAPAYGLMHDLRPRSRKNRDGTKAFGGCAVA